MARARESWGIEIGYNAIKAMRLVQKGGRLIMADYDVIPFKKVLSTPDLNVSEAIQVNLDQFLSRHSVNRSNVVVSVPGHKAFSRSAKLPPVDPKKIPDIVKFEAVQQIPFPIEQVEWDYHVFSQADSPDVEVNIFAITKEKIEEELNNCRAVGLSVDAMTLSPLAVYNAMYFDLELDETSPGVIFLDIGTVSTDVIIADEGRLWLRPVPIGGNNFTEALVRAFKLSFPKAEKLKREAGTSKYARQIFQAMRPVFADLVQELQKTLGFYQTLNRDANLTKLIGLGSTFRLPGMSKFLKQQLQIEVIRPETFDRLEVEDKQAAEFAEQALNLATAYGCALQGLGLGRVDANILPEDLLRRRFWRAKQPWIGAAAALMIAASGAAGVKLAMDRKAFTSELESSQNTIDAVIRDAETKKDGWSKIEGGEDPRRRIENLRRILDYRDVWPKLMHDITLVAANVNPQPELLKPNYDLIAKIPRSQRRRIFIESVQAQYRFGAVTSNAASAAPAPVAGMSIDEIWGANAEPVESAPPPGPGGRPGPRAPAPAPTSTPAGGQSPPQFVITIRGTTPYAEGAQFLTRNLLQWLRDHHSRPDRPYQIVTDTVAMTSIATVGGAPAAAPGAGPGGGGWNNPAANKPKPAATTATGQENQPTLPKRAIEGEDRSNDYRFVITWTVQLIRPEDARRAEDEELEKAGVPKPAAAPAGASPAREPASNQEKKL
jgi:type IV pilus assembly protein PilM